MKSILFLSWMMLFAHAILGQKFEDREMSFPHVILPLKKLPQNISSYCVTINSKSTAGYFTSNQQVSLGYIKPTGKAGSTISGVPCNYSNWVTGNEDYINSLVKMGHLERKELSSADMIINIDIGWLSIMSEEKKSRELNLGERKVWEGGYFMQWVCPTGIKITERLSGKVILEQSLRKREDNYAMTIWERDYMCVGNSVNMRTSYIMDVVNRETFSKVIKILNDYETKRVSRAITLFMPSFKSYNYDEILRANNLMVEASVYIAKDRPRAMENVQKAIEMYEKMLLLEDKNDDKARVNGKIAEALHANLAAAYWVKEDYKKCQTELGFLTNVPKIKKVAKEWLPLVEDDVHRLSINR